MAPRPLVTCWPAPTAPARRCAASSSAARLAPSVRLTGMPGYLSWMLPLADPRLFHADAVSLHREAARLVEGWHPAVRRIIAEADAPATFAVCITSAQPV